MYIPQGFQWRKEKTPISSVKERDGHMTAMGKKIQKKGSCTLSRTSERAAIIDIHEGGCALKSEQVREGRQEAGTMT